MIGKCLAIDLKDQGVAVRLLHPGYVKTDMTKGNGNIEADEAAKGLIARMDELNIESTGEFFHSNSEKLPWQLSKINLQQISWGWVFQIHIPLFLLKCSAEVHKDKQCVTWGGKIYNFIKI